MAVYTPPTESLPIFDNSVFPSSDGTALTVSTGQKYFLSYPVAQGEEIFPSNITLQSSLTDSTGTKGTLGQVLSSTVSGIEWVNAGGITGNLDLPPPYKLLTDTITESASHVAGTDINLYGTTTDDDILIGSTLGAGHTLRLCNTTLGTSGGSVHCCNIGFDGTNINNATNPATGIVKIANTQTTGALYLGGGSTTAARTTGPIIIGSDSTATGGINIGTGTDLTVPTVNTLNIGKSSYTTNINGTVVPNGITFPSDKYITSTPSASIITGPTAPTQVGCIVNYVSITVAIPTTNLITSLASVTITQGTWILHAYRQYNNSANCTRIIFSFGLNLRLNATPASSDYEYGLVTVPLSGVQNYVGLSAAITATAIGNTVVYFNIQPTYTSAPESGITNFRFTATRIA